MARWSKWLDDVPFHLASAMRGVLFGIVAVAWASVFLSSAEISTQAGTGVLIASAVLSLVLTHLLDGLPPSAGAPWR